MKLRHIPGWRSSALLLAAALLAVAASAQTTTLVSYGTNGKLSYTPTANGDVVPDFSGVGYRNSEVPIPDVLMVRSIGPVSGDNRARIQDLIDEVAALPLRPDGFRGAIEFAAGVYNLSGTLYVRASGIVLRGAGSHASGTRFQYNDNDDTDCLRFEGPGGISLIESSRSQVQGSYVPYGAKQVTVSSGHGFVAGDWVVLHYQPTQAWIDLLRMNSTYMMDGSTDESWSVSGSRYRAERQVVSVDGNTLHLDAPVMDPVQASNRDLDVVKITSQRIENVGVEGIRFLSDPDNATDLLHGWKAVAFQRVKHGWARNLEAYYFGYAAVSVEDDDSSFITVDNCKMIDPVGEYGTGRRYAFNVNGQRILVQNSSSSGGGRHCFVSGSFTPGPSVFYNCTTTGALSDAGPHHRWTTGHLYDKVTSDNEIRVRNRLISGSGHGWAGAQIMMWNCSADRIVVQDPQGPHTNWAIGCIGDVTGVDSPNEPAGIIESEGTHIAAIPSLFLAQLNDRLGGTEPSSEVYRNDDPPLFNGTTTMVDGGTTPGSGQSLTVAFFATPAKLASMGAVDKLPASGSQGWSVKMRSNGDLWFRIGSEATKQDVIATGAYSAGNKVHIACTFSGGIGRIYVNGVLAGEQPGITAYGVANTTTPLRLGIPSSAAQTNIYEGELEYVRIYNYALTSAQIAAMAEQTPPVARQEPVRTYNGTTDYDELGTAPGSSTQLTVAFFARADKRDNMGVIDKLPASGSAGWSVKLRSNGDLWFRVGSEATRTDTIATGVYAANTRVHIAVTFGGGTAEVFVNGSRVASQSGITYGVNNTTTPLRLGIPSAAALSNIYDGTLEQVRIYNAVLTPEQISELATNVAPVWSRDALTSFNGSTTVYDGGTSPGSASSLTVAFFATPAQLAAMGPVDKLPSSGTAGWSVKLRANGDLWFRVGSEATRTDTIATGVYNPNVRVHLACTFTGGTARIYVDGVQVASQSGITYGVNNTTTPLRLGIPSSAAQTNIYQGTLENVRVYHSALGAAQIQNLANEL